MTNEMTPKEVFSRLGFAILSISIINILLSVVLLRIAEIFSPGISMDSNFKVVISSITMYLIGMPVAYFILKKIPKSEMPNKKIGIGKEITICICGYTMGICTSFAAMEINSLIGKMTGHGAVNPIQNTLMGANAFTLFCAVILAPIMEELVFRKLVIDRIACYGEGVAMIVSGLLFGLIHGNFQQASYAFVLGVFFAYVYLRTGRIIYTMIAHFFVNLVGSVASVLIGRIDLEKVNYYVTNGKMDEYTEYVYAHMDDFMLIGLFAIVVIGIVLAGIILLIVNIKHFYFNSKEGELAEGKKFSTVILNPGFITYIAYFVLMIVLAQFEISVATSLIKLLM